MPGTFCESASRSAKAVEFFDGQSDIVEDTFKETFLEGSTSMDRHGHTPVICWPFQGEMAAALVGRLESEPLEQWDEFASGEDRKFLTAHAGQERSPGRFQ